ncbi:hypothetical protein [Nocardia sp. BMG51109]|uniref:hypothetical protein n=1 Tax=Nocardia sp. BMG51109 TaxID=1056816 RepID=UPI00046578DA|nr:hypothetical protein [Nocardia sp. BMG51109]
MMKRTVAAATAAVAASLFAFGQSWAQEPTSQFVVTENATAIANITDPADNTCHPAVVTADAPRTVYWVNKTPLYATLYIRAADGPECGGAVLNRLRPGAVGAAPATLQGTVVDVRFSSYQ